MKECPVCFTHDATRRLVCGHTFCDSCLKKWYGKNPTCPMCRRSLYFKGMRHVVKGWNHWDASIEHLFDNYHIDVEYLKHFEKKFHLLNEHIFNEEEFIDILLDDDIEIVHGPTTHMFWEFHTCELYMFTKKKPLARRRVSARPRSNWLLEK